MVDSKINLIKRYIQNIRKNKIVHRKSVLDQYNDQYFNNLDKKEFYEISLQNKNTLISDIE